MKVYLRTFGCRATRYDSEAVRSMVEADGHAIVSSRADADVAVFNSSRSRPRRKPSSERSCAGARANGGAAKRRDGMRGGARRARVRRRRGSPPCRGWKASWAEPISTRSRARSDSRGVRSGADERTGRDASAVAIQDGCDEHCTFCATTLPRRESQPVARRTRTRGTILADRHPGDRRSPESTSEPMVPTSGRRSGS